MTMRSHRIFETHPITGPGDDSGSCRVVLRDLALVEIGASVVTSRKSVTEEWLRCSCPRGRTERPERNTMNRTRKIIITVGAFALVAVIAVGGLLITRSSGSQAADDHTTRSSSVHGGGRSTAPLASPSVRSEDSTGIATSGVTSGSASPVIDDARGASTSSAGATTSPSGSIDAGSPPADGGPAGGSPSSSGASPVSPAGDRASWGPVTTVSPVADIPLLDLGPTLSSPIWSCGSKIIFSVTATDPNGVVSVWGSYYVGGTKQSFTSSNASGNVWSTTIIAGSGVPVTGLVVYAKDGAGNNANLAVGTLCA